MRRGPGPEHQAGSRQQTRRQAPFPPPRVRPATTHAGSHGPLPDDRGSATLFPTAPRNRHRAWRIASATLPPTAIALPNPTDTCRNGQCARPTICREHRPIVRLPTEPSTTTNTNTRGSSSVWSPIHHRGAQSFAGVMQPGPDRPDRTSQRRTNLVAGLTVEIMHGHDIALLGR